MNLVSTTRALLIVVAISVAAPSNLYSMTLVADDFESYDVGAWPSPNWVAHAHAADVPAENHVALDPDTVSQNDKALRLQGIVNWAAIAYHTFDIQSNFIIEAQVWNGNEDQPAGWGRGSIGIAKGIDWTGPGRTLFQFWPDGTWQSEGGLSGSFETERWYGVRIHYNRQGSDLALRYWLDGIFAGDANVVVADVPTEAMFGYLNLTAGGTSYFDDIRVQAVPEPATATIMLIGTFALFCATCCRCA
jgi:hypothetical protein